MIWQLYFLMVGLALILIIIGLARPSESSQALIGFTFLFLLSFVILGNNLEYEAGYNTTHTYNYLEDNSTIDFIQETHIKNYDVLDDNTGVFTTHRFGYFMAVASAIGFFGVLYSLKGGWKKWAYSNLN